MDLDKRAKAIKLLKEKTLCYFRFNKDFFREIIGSINHKRKS